MSLSFDDFAHGRDPLIEFAKTIGEPLARRVYGDIGLDSWRRESPRPAMR